MPDQEKPVRHRATPRWVSSDRHKAIIRALVAARVAAGATQRDVAAKLGKPPSFVGKVEANERNLSVLELVEWSDAIGVDPATILRKARARG
ncbi:MAG: helix-turn-helix transcriptional regulator [Tabrizicola sp.]|nr:helix-turn-helix transcriptional regulator [Tabrizicola sp.]